MAPKRSYTDEELKDILSFSPTRNNLKMLAEKYGRSEEAIYEICCWANTTTRSLIKRKRWNGFVKQIKRIATEIGLLKLPRK